MKHVVILLIVFSPWTFSCKSKGKDLTALAGDFCACFTTINDSISAETVRLYNEIVEKKAVTTAQQKEVLGEDKNDMLSHELGIFMEAIQAVPGPMTCATQVKAKHGMGHGPVMGDADELLKLLGDSDNCNAAKLYILWLSKPY